MCFSDLCHKLLNAQRSLELLVFQHLKGYLAPRNYSALIWQKVYEHDFLVPKINRYEFPKKHGLWEDMGFTPSGWVIWESKEDMTVREDTWQVPELQLREVFHKTDQFIKRSQTLPARSVVGHEVVERGHLWWSQSLSILFDNGEANKMVKQWLTQRKA